MTAVTAAMMTKPPAEPWKKNTFGQAKRRSKDAAVLRSPGAVPFWRQKFGAVNHRRLSLKEGYRAVQRAMAGRFSWSPQVERFIAQTKAAAAQAQA